MNSLLARQVRKHLPAVDPSQEPWRSFFQAVSAAYQELQDDRNHIEHTLEVASTELTEANERLRIESEHRLQSLDNSYREVLELQEGMILCFRQEGEDFIHTLCRGQLANRLGWTPATVEGKSWRAVMAGEAFTEVEAAYRRAAAGETTSFEATIGEITLLAQLRPRGEPGQCAREVIVSCIDISRLKAFEHDLRAAKNRAEKADKAKSEFLAVMSHEIRTPLNAILGFTDLLQETELDAQQGLWVKTVATSGESLRSLIDDILDFSKIEAGRVELNETSVGLADFLGSIQQMFEPRAQARRLQFALQGAPTLPQRVQVDSHRLRQVLVNLIGNAIKFTEEGGVMVRIGFEPTEAGGRLCIEVEDTGVGIRPEARERLFKPFSQADSSTTRVYGGTGLGLAICQRLVRLMGGEIDFRPAPVRGTVFFFHVHVRLAEGAVRREAPVVSPPAVEGLRVLVVEDRPVNHDLMREVLERYGCRTRFAENGVRAVETAGAEDFDLIVMDLQMPEMDGFEATRRIRALERPNCHPRIVALTASTLAEEHSLCRSVGMDAVLTKPLRLEALRAELARANLRVRQGA